MSDPMTPERLFEIRVQRSTARACKTVDAVAVFEAVDELLTEVERLRLMEAALAAARELHAPVTVDDLGLAVQACRNCCIDASGYDRTSNCEELHLHGPGRPICPTRAALDGGA